MQEVRTSRPVMKMAKTMAAPGPKWTDAPCAPPTTGLLEGLATFPPSSAFTKAEWALRMVEYLQKSPNNTWEL